MIERRKDSFYKKLALLAMFLICMMGAKAQGDFSGTYYIASHRIYGTGNPIYSNNTPNGDKYYLVPAQNPQQNPPKDVYYDAEHVWNKIHSVSELQSGDQIIIAARYNSANSNYYYAMPATPTGQPVGVSFQSVANEGVEWLPDAIVNNIGTYRWTVNINNGAVTLTNDSNKTLGYTSGTNFVGNDNNNSWIFDMGISGNNAMVPNYEGFVITNASFPNRGVALQRDQNNAYEFGPFAITNNNSSTYNFYLDIFVRHVTYRDPYLTTYRTNADPNSVWNIAKTADDYYTIRHIASGKYMVFARTYPDGNGEDFFRKAIHLEATDNPGENAKFAIAYQDQANGVIVVRPKSLPAGSNENSYLNVHHGNQPYYYGTSTNYSYGLVALYKYDNHSYWHFEPVTVPNAPVISYNNATEKIIINHDNPANTSGYTIYWTNDGSTPAQYNTLTPYTAPTSPIQPIAPCTIKAIVVDNDTNLPSTITTFYLEQVDVPTAALTNNAIVLSSTTDGATIHYTTNGSNPTTNSNTYSSPLGDSHAGETIRFIAVKANMINSSIASAVYQKAATPVIEDNGDNHIAISCATPDVSIFYTTDGSTPTTSSTLYTEPLDNSHSGETIRAIAVKSGWFNSDIGQGVVTFQCSDPSISINEETGAVIITIAGSSGYTFFYTTNGLDPNPEVYGGTYPTQVYDPSNPFVLTSSTTVKVIATKAGNGNSNIATQSFEQVAAPVLTFTDELIITCATADATVRYKLDAGEWANYNNTSSPLTPHTTGITLGTTQLSVKTVKTGMVPYFITPLILDQANAPVIAEDGNNAISITSATTGASIRFTTDESNPKTSSTAVDYAGALGRDSYSGEYWNTLTSENGLHIHAFASKANMFWSIMGESEHARLYTLIPTVDISTGQIVITITPLPSDPSYTYQIRYTTTGTAPTQNSTLYTGPVNLTEAANILAVGQRGTYLSAVSELINISKVDDPILRDNGDNHITITTATLGAYIYYTTNGNDPVVTFDTNTSTFTLGEDTFYYDPSHPLDYTYSGQTIKAIAVKAGMLNSNIVSSSITLHYPEPSIDINPANGEVSISGLGESGELFYYTTDGSTPTTSSSLYDPAHPFSIYDPAAADSPYDVTVKAITVRSGWNPSNPSSQVLHQTDKCEVNPTSGNEIEITCGTSGVTIFYTTDGSTLPTCTYDATTGEFTAGAGTSLYLAPLSHSLSGNTIMALAVKEEMIPDTIIAYPPHLKCKKPLINRYGDNLVLTAGGFPETVTIFYTRNGDDPIVNFDGSSYSAGANTYQYTGQVDMVSQEWFGPNPDHNSRVTVKAIAVAVGYTPSAISTKTIAYSLQYDSEGNYYLIQNDGDLDIFVNMANHDGHEYHYKLTDNVNAAGIGTIDEDFTGILEGTANEDGVYYTIRDLSHPLFNTIDGGTVKNIMFGNVNISQSGHVGTVASLTKGATRIYNCGVYSGSLEGTSAGSCVGGIVGRFDSNDANNTSRVINCFSYADVSSGNGDGAYAAGIVGYNCTSTASNNLKTMVMNCMFYGDILEGAKKAPIYGGKIISNKDNNGVSNFNYFRAEASYVQNRQIDPANCALMAETRFLQRFEFFRHLLNGHRELAAWWATGDIANKDEMLKWVMIPDSIGTTHPYPDLRDPGKYPSVVNYQAPTAATTPPTPRNQGGWLGELTVKIQMGDGAVYNHPDGAVINNADAQGIATITLPITDKDTTHFNYNYYKVQLPYYNDYGTMNYTSNRVVAGWKIVKINDSDVGTGTFTNTGGDVTYDASGNPIKLPFNFADRNCSNKDLYASSNSGVVVGGRVFNQGAYWDVPEGVTSITIEPYWAKAVYLADAFVDVVFNTDMTDLKNVPNVGGGQIYTNNTEYNIAGSNQKVYTVINKINDSNPKAFDALFKDDNGVTISEEVTKDHSVYDYAIVLVGNYHLYSANSGAVINNSTKRPYTITSIDLDHDNEPDYNLIMRFNGRTTWHPVRFDFINMPGFGMAQKSQGGPGSYNFAIPQPLGWFEATNTSLFRVTQFEYSPSSRAKKPIILQGGVIEQWVCLQGNPGDRVQYFHVGGNVWFKEFHLGVHQDNSYATPHPPITVTGGDFNIFYLTGAYRSDAPNYEDHAECYVNGGRFGSMSGAGMEGIGNSTTHAKGNIFWQIDNADINEFFGGGINASKPIQGNIHTVISNSYVTLFCGGPKFGDMENDRTVTTTATNCVFGEFYGAGYGGNSYGRRAPFNYQNIGTSCTPNNNNMLYTEGYGHGSVVYGNIDWNRWVNGEAHNNNQQGDDYAGYLQDYSSKPGYTGVSVGIDYQFLPMSDNYRNVARLFINYVKFSLATTRNVKSTLTNCTVMQDYYGGGRLGKVAGDAESILNSCTIYGNVFGGGFTGILPTVEVMNTGGFQTPPYYDYNLGVYLPAVFPETVTYTWEHRGTVNSTETAIDKVNHVLYTEEDTGVLGTVTGHTKVTVTGNTYVEGLIDGEPAGGVFGGGNEAWVGSSEVIINTEEEEGSYPINNVYGGGNVAVTNENAEVTILHGLIGQMENDQVVVGTGNVYGGGRGRMFNEGEDPTNATVHEMVRDLGYVGGNTFVRINGGYIRYNVYGGGKLASVDGSAFITMNGGQVGPLDMTGLNAYVYGGGEGVEIDYSNTYKDFANVSNTSVTVNGGHVWGSIFGGGADGHVLGDAAVNLNGGILGTTGTTTWDGNIFGGGRNYRSSNYAAGRVGGNITVTMTGGTMYGSVFGGGRLGNTGVNEDGYMVPDLSEVDTCGHVFVHICGGTVGNPDILDNPTIYYDHFGAIGHVFGAAKGQVGDLNLGQVKETYVKVSGNPTILGSVYGGSENGAVRGAEGDADGSGNPTKGNTFVTVNGGTIGAMRIVSVSKGYKYEHINGGKVFGGGRGSTDYYDAGLVYRNSTVNIKGGHVLHSVYGGGEVANIGSSGNLNTGLATVTVNGGQVGPAPDPTHGIEIGLSGRDGYVFGGGQGIGDDPGNLYKNFANVNNTIVTVEMPMPQDNDNTNRIWGSIFGGGEDGHVLGNATVYYKNGLMGTKGTTSYDGNIFGGGRNYERKNYTAGRVGGNISVEMSGGTMLGTIFGGGRLGLTGVDVNGQILDGDDHGLVTVKVKGGTIGNKDLIESWTNSSMGDVFGGGKGTMDGVIGHPAASALLVSLTKNTIVEISEEDPENHPTIIYGSVFGGGEVANVGHYLWDPDPTYGVSNIRLKEGSGMAKVTVSGGRIGIDRMRMSYDPSENTDLGHVFGGGKGIVGDPDDYALIDPEYNNKSLIDLMATVGNTEVTISGTAWVKGSVYGGAENGHVLGDTYVKVEGGQIGSGQTPAGVEEVRYTEDQFFDPLTTTVNDDNKLAECAHWPFESPYHPYDPVDVSQGIYPTDGKTFFGNVFGGGSGYFAYVKNGHSEWNRMAGIVEGNTRVEITGGHILTSVYGGCETTDIGLMDHTTGQYISGGNSTVVMTGGTLGVPRTNEQIQEHPVTCYLYGSGKGDPRIYFNTWTNVRNANVEMTDGIIYGSLFGGGEEGHVIGDVNINISDKATIGTIGYSYVDGNVFGGGRGFNAEALTAGTVGGNIEVNISGGTMLGSIYGGGRNGSVGTHLVDVEIEDPENPGQMIANPLYGRMQHDVKDDPETEEDETVNHGHITVNISGGTIGNDHETVEEPIGGNVFGGCMGLATSTIWNRIARAKQTEVLVTGNPFIKGSVFGGSEQGSIVIDTIMEENAIKRLDGGTTHVLVQGGTIGWMNSGVSPTTGADTAYHVGGDVYGGGKGYDLPGKEFSGIVQLNTTVNIEGGHILYNIYGGGEMASVGLTTNRTSGGKTYHQPVVGTGIATVNFTGGELGPAPKPDGSEGLNGLDGYLFGGGKGIWKTITNNYTIDDFINDYKWFGDVNKTVVNVSGGRIWGSVFGGSEDGHVLDSVYVTFSDGTIGTHGITGYDGNIFSGGRDYADIHSTVGRVGGNIVTRMTGGYLLGSMFGGGRQGAVGVDDYGIMKMDETSPLRKYGYLDVAITSGVVGHDRLHGDPLIGGNVYGGGKGKAHKFDQGMAKDAKVTITGDAEIKGSVFGAGENGHILGMTHVTIGDAIVDDETMDGSQVTIGGEGLPGMDGNVYGGGRGDGTYIENGQTKYSPTAGYTGVSTHVLINNGKVNGSVYGGGRMATVGIEEMLTYYDGSVFTPTDFGRTNVTITGNAEIGSKRYDNGHVFGGGRGEPHPDFDDFTNVFETFVHIEGDAQVNGSVFGGAEDGHVIDYVTTNPDLSSIAAAKNGDTHVFIDGSSVIGDGSNNEMRGSVYGGGRGLDKYELNGVMVANPAAGKVEGNTHATLFSGTVRRYMFGGGNQSLVHGRKTVNVEDGIVMRDVYGGCRHVDNTWRHPGLKTVNIYGGTVNNVFGCGYNVIDGDPDHPANPTAFVNISGGHVGESVHGAGQAGTVHGSTIIYIGKNAIYNAPYNSADIDRNDLHSEKAYFHDITGEGETPTGEAHKVSKLLVDASVYGGSSYFDEIGSSTNWSNYTVKGFSNIYIDGTSYNMEALTSGWNYESMPSNAMVISGNIFGSGTHCESGEMGRNVIVREYGERNTDDNGWFNGSTRTMGTIQRVGNLLIDHSNFTFTGQSALGNNAYENLCAVYKVDSCFYVANGSGLCLGQDDAITDMDSIRVIRSVHLKSGNAYSNTHVRNLDWEWIGIRESSDATANGLYYYNAPANSSPLSYNDENVMVFNTTPLGTSMLKVRYTGRPVGQPTAPVKQYYGELQGFFRMTSGLLPWGMKSFCAARPKLTVENLGIEAGQTPVNKGDGGFLSYKRMYNFFISEGSVGNDGGDAQTFSKQYPYTNVIETSKGDLEDYRIWVVGEFKGHRWYVDGTRNWGRDGLNVSGSTTTGWGWGLFADRPKKTIKAIFEEGAYLYNGSTIRDFQWQDDIVYYTEPGGENPAPEGHQAGEVDYEKSKFKDVIYVVGPIDCNSVSEYAMLNPHPEEPLMLYRYPGGHKLSNSTNKDPEDIKPGNFGNDSYDGTIVPITLSPNTNVGATTINVGPGANYDAMIDVGSTQAVVLANVSMDGLYGHVGLDNTYLSIPDSYQMKDVSQPMVVTEEGSELTVKGGTLIQRGYNNHIADYYNMAPSSAYMTPMGGALYVHPQVTKVNMEGLVEIKFNWHKLTETEDIISNVFLPSFDQHMKISDALSPSSFIGVTSPVCNNEASYTLNTFSPVAVGTRAGSSEVGGVMVDNAVIDVQNAWHNNNFTDDLDCFFGSGTNEQFGSHSTYYKAIIPNYGGSYSTDRTLFFGWTWNNVVRSQPAGFTVDGTNITISTKEGLAWLISCVNGFNNKVKSSLADTTILLTADVDGLDKYVWVPAGSTSISDDIETEHFAGSFDGQGHLVKNLTIAYIGIGDGRYQFTDYGMFGKTNGAKIDRTFLVGEYIEPNSNGNMGGMVGVMQGAGSLISNSEAQARIVASNQGSTQGCGGLAGLLVDGEICSSMAMPDIRASVGYIGGLVGASIDPDTHVGSIVNSFANARFDVGSTSNASVEVGGIIGYNQMSSVNNCYSYIQSGSTLPDDHFGSITSVNRNGVTGSFGPAGYKVNHSNQGSGSERDCGLYTSVIGSDELGYLYSDNIVYLGDGIEDIENGTLDTTLTARLTMNAWRLNSGVMPAVSDSLYAHWARPGLNEINNDMPVLLLKEFDVKDVSENTIPYQGSFRSVGTYDGGPALQYGGPARDGDGNTPAYFNPELDGALARAIEGNSLFIYGDIIEAPTIAASADKISIYEHAAIMHPGSLVQRAVGGTKEGDPEPYSDIYVGITFDNSKCSALSSPGMNQGLNGIGTGPYLLKRDWHMFSTPLSNAPLGFDYGEDNVNGGPQNNPWVNTTMEFSWLNNNAPGDNRYWMGEGLDGYFPKNRGRLFSDQTNPDLPLESEIENLFIVNSPESPSDECPEIGRYRYPYGMDMYSWSESQYHWVNFKRNGPNHWHSDDPHVQLEYVSEVATNNATPATNANETILISGKGYMASIAKETFMQSHGTLNADEQTINLTLDGKKLTGWNLIGNPYHGYLDFTEFASDKDNEDVLKDPEEEVYEPFYVVYDADGFTGLPVSAYLTYPVSGSKGGAYAGRYLHPHQGFYVKAGTKGAVKFTEDMLVPRSVLDETTNEGHFRGGEENDDDRPAYPLINLFLSSEQGCSDITVVELDRPEWGGACKMKELRVGNGIFYARCDEKNYAALFAPKGVNRIPLWFEPKANDNFTISWNTANADFASMYLVDNITGVQYDMLLNDSYTFEANKNDYYSRFYITFVLEEEGNDDEDNNSFVFFDGSQWVVTGEGTLQFIDVLGHILMQTEMTSMQNWVNLPRVASGVYLMRLINGEEIKVQKIIVKNRKD